MGGVVYLSSLLFNEAEWTELFAGTVIITMYKCWLQFISLQENVVFMQPDERKLLQLL